MDAIQGSYQAPVRRTLSAAVVLSLLLHAGAAGVLSWTGTHNLGSMANAGQISQLDTFQAFTDPEPKPEPPKPEPPKPKELEAEKPPPPPPEMEQERVRLGIDESNAKTETWKGAAKATEHMATKSEVEQPALAISPGAPGPADPGISDSGAAASQAAMMGPPAPSETAAQPPPVSTEQAATPETAEAPTKPMQLDPRQDQPVQPDLKQPLPVQPLPQQVEPKQPIAAPAGTGPLEVGPVQDKDIQPLPEQPKPLQKMDQMLKPLQPKDVQMHLDLEDPKELVPAKEAKDAPKEEPKDKVTPQKAASGQAAQGAPGVRANAPDAQPGQKAEEESAAAAVTESLVYKPGQPLAGKGLKVNTVSPRWGITTLVTSSPKNTVIRITFGRNGKVLKAAFVDAGTGYADVDGPLLDAVYRWTAKGEVLEKIPADKPQAGLNFDIKFLMNGR